MDMPHVTKWLAATIVGLLLIGALLFVLLSGCVPAHQGWTRAEVHQNPASQQAALDKDREACIAEGTAKGIYYQALMGSLDMTACLERRGWKRIP